MQKVPVKAIRRQLMALIPVYMNVLMMGCTVGWLPNAIYFLLIGEEEEGIHATSSQCALIASLSQLGKIIFAIPGGIIVDKYGRRKITISIAFLHFLSWMVLSSDTSLSTIYGTQLMLGVGLALVQETGLITIGEIASPGLRCQLTSMYQIFLCGGVILPAIISVIFSSYMILTRIIMLLSFVTLLSMILTKESAHFLISVPNMKQAKQNMMLFREGYPQHEVDKEFEKLQKYIEDEISRKSNLNMVDFFKLKTIWKPLTTATLINFFTKGTGINLIRTYVAAIYPSNEYVPKKYYALIMQIIILLVAVTTTFYIEKFPRRVILIFGTVAVTASNVFSAVVNYFYIETEKDIFKWLFILGNILLVVFFNAFVQPINNVIKSELFPQSVKGFGGSLSILSQAFSTIVSYQMYYFINSDFQLYHMYVILSLNSAILCVLVYFMLPESRGSCLADLQEKYQE